METADQSLSKREECVSTLQAEIRELQGTTPDLDMVLETPPKSGSSLSDKGTATKSLSLLEKFRRSISKLELSADIEEESENIQNRETVDKLENEKIRKSHSVHTDSSGVGLDSDMENFSDAESEIIEVIQLRNSINKCISEVMESPERKNGNTVSFNQSSLLEYTAGINENASMDNYGSPEPEQITPLTLNNQQKNCDSVSIKNMMNKKLDYEIHRPLDDSRVLQIVLTPLKNKLIFKHTKSSMLRLKNSPVKDPNHGRECKKAKAVSRRSLHMDKENFYGQDEDRRDRIRGKRKCMDKENEKSDLNTSKRRKVLGGKTKGKAKLRRSSAKRPQYNLRTRR